VRVKSGNVNASKDITKNLKWGHMTDQEAIKYVADAIGITPQVAIQRLVFESGEAGTRRKMHIEEQDGKCTHPLCPNPDTPLLDDQYETHLDHIWSKTQSAEDCWSGKIGLSEMNKQFNSETNIQALHK
jgi:hypothetical protein